MCTVNILGRGYQLVYSSGNMTHLVLQITEVCEDRYEYLGVEGYTCLCSYGRIDDERFKHYLDSLPHKQLERLMKELL